MALSQRRSRSFGEPLEEVLKAGVMTAGPNLVAGHSAMYRFDPEARGRFLARLDW
jgi:hypothetical protein